jgi:hypothetical protein
LGELGRQRRLDLSRDKRDLIPDGSGRAVTPDCPRILRGSEETAELLDGNNLQLVDRYELLASEADYLLALFGDIHADS